MSLIPSGKGTVGSTTVGVREVGSEGGVVVMSREGTVVTTETK